MVRVELFKTVLKWTNITGINDTVQGKFVRIHFGTNGKIAGADIESCELFVTSLLRLMAFVSCNIVYVCAYDGNGKEGHLMPRYTHKPRLLPLQR